MRVRIHAWIKVRKRVFVACVSSLSISSFPFSCPIRLCRSCTPRHHVPVHLFAELSRFKKRRTRATPHMQRGIRLHGQVRCKHRSNVAGGSTAEFDQLCASRRRLAAFVMLYDGKIMSQEHSPDHEMHHQRVDQACPDDTNALNIKDHGQERHPGNLPRARRASGAGCCGVRRRTHTAPSPCTVKVLTFETHHQRFDQACPGDTVAMDIKRLDMNNMLQFGEVTV